MMPLARSCPPGSLHARTHTRPLMCAPRVLRAILTCGLHMWPQVSLQNEAAEHAASVHRQLPPTVVVSTDEGALNEALEAKATLDDLGPSTGATALADGADHLLSMVTAAAG